MTLANMEKFKRQPLNIQPEEGDVVWAGVAVEQARKIALDDATKATSRGDTDGAALATARAANLSKAIRAAPGATGVRWREREDRWYFIVPGVGHVQSIVPDYFAELFGDDETLPVETILASWGWSRQG